MKKFVIERALPGAGKLTQEELAGITATSCNVVSNLNEPYHWVESFVTDDKIFCIHIAESEEVVREHAKRGNFPVTSVYEVKSIIDPTTK
ncbi:MAG: DUF4242 domain-containing protein [Pedobacter sp.]|nr:DUF4242 domain-containing protein [Pedobacter sp.]